MPKKQKSITMKQRLAELEKKVDDATEKTDDVVNRMEGMLTRLQERLCPSLQNSWSEQSSEYSSELDSESENSQPRKRHKPAEQEDEESIQSIVVSECNDKMKEQLIGESFTFYELRNNDQFKVTKENFHLMIQLEPDFPNELAKLAYRDLAASIGSTEAIDELNEATRQAIMFSMISKVCTYVTSLFDFKRKSDRPVIETEKLMVWMFKKKPVRGKPDIGIVKKRSAKKEATEEEEESSLITDNKTYYFLVEMKATTINEGMKQGLVYLKRAREMNEEDAVFIFLFFPTSTSIQLSFKLN